MGNLHPYPFSKVIPIFTPISIGFSKFIFISIPIPIFISIGYFEFYSSVYKMQNLITIDSVIFSLKKFKKLI